MQKKWFQTWWGVSSAGLLGVLVVSLVGFLVMAGWFWWQISHGQEPLILKTIQEFKQTRPQTNGIDRIRLEDKNSQYLGRVDAPITIVEFVDYKCPNSRAEAAILKQVLAKYGTRFKLIMRYFPVETLYPGASQAAELVYCASRQGKFWQMGDFLYANQDFLPSNFGPDDLVRFSESLEMNSEMIKACMKDQITFNAVNKDYMDGVLFGVKGTPAFFINGQKVEGVISMQNWDKLFETFSAN